MYQESGGMPGGMPGGVPGGMPSGMGGDAGSGNRGPTIEEVEARSFGVDTCNLRKILVESAKGGHEGFLVELVKSAGYALAKIRNDEYLSNEEKVGLCVKIMPNHGEGTLTVADNGCGTSVGELEGVLGSVTYPETSQSCQFGLGFYSVFKVANKVEVISKKDGEQHILMSSTGCVYNIDSYAGELDRGTSVILHLKKEYSMFLLPTVIEEIIQKHFKFIDFPIKLISNGQAEMLLNAGQTIWTQNFEKVSHEDYINLYRYLSGDNDEPISTKPFSYSGGISMHGVLLLSKNRGKNMDRLGIKVYLNRTCISNNINSSIRQYLPYLYGIINIDGDSITLDADNSLPYNLENEKNEHLLEVLFKWFEELSQNEKIYCSISDILKPFILSVFFHDKSFISLLRYYSSKSENRMISFDEYISRMKKNQKEIYLVGGESIEMMRESAICEMLFQSDVEVLYTIDPNDNDLFSGYHEYKGYRLVGVAALCTDIYLNKEDEEKHAKAWNEYASACSIINQYLPDKNIWVKVSRRLVNTPCCAIVDSVDKFSSSHSHHYNVYDLDGILFEINPNHETIIRLKELCTDENAKADVCAPVIQMLFETALIDGSYTLSDPIQYSNLVYEVIRSSLNLSKPAMPILAGDKGGDPF
ncbi:hypothetical protein ACTXT7_016716 [Hymenolepis weldensis]